MLASILNGGEGVMNEARTGGGDMRLDLYYNRYTEKLQKE